MSGCYAHFVHISGNGDFLRLVFFGHLILTSNRFFCYAPSPHTIGIWSVYPFDHPELQGSNFFCVLHARNCCNKILLLRKNMKLLIFWHDYYSKSIIKSQKDTNKNVMFTTTWTWLRCNVHYNRTIMTFHRQTSFPTVLRIAEVAFHCFRSMPPSSWDSFTFLQGKKKKRNKWLDSIFFSFSANFLTCKSKLTPDIRIQLMSPSKYTTKVILCFILIPENEYKWKEWYGMANSIGNLEYYTYTRKGPNEVCPWPFVRHEVDLNEFPNLDCSHPLCMKEGIPMDNLHSLAEYSSFSIEALQPSN